MPVVARSTLAGILSGHRLSSAETAMRLSLCFGVDAQFWLSLQTRYNLMMLDERRGKIEREVHLLSKAA